MPVEGLLSDARVQVEDTFNNVNAGHEQLLQYRPAPSHSLARRLLTLLPQILQKHQQQPRAHLQNVCGADIYYNSLGVPLLNSGLPLNKARNVLGRRLCAILSGESWGLQHHESGC